MAMSSNVDVFILRTIFAVLPLGYIRQVSNMLLGRALSIGYCEAAFFLQAPAIAMRILRFHTSGLL